MAAARDSRPPARRHHFCSSLLLDEAAVPLASVQRKSPFAASFGLPLILHRVGYAARVQICLFVCPHRQSSFSPPPPAPARCQERTAAGGGKTAPAKLQTTTRAIGSVVACLSIGHAIDDSDDWGRHERAPPANSDRI